MSQDITANADVFSNDLKSTGHAAIYGSFFDTNKSELKPELTQAIAEIAKLLQADPGLKVHVVGHTDSVGTVEANLKLSMERAESVVQALIRSHVIAALRIVGRMVAGVMGCYLIYQSLIMIYGGLQS
jgi:OmpA-OmpF porin, OOP family